MRVKTMLTYIRHIYIVCALNIAHTLAHTDIFPRSQSLSCELRILFVVLRIVSSLVWICGEGGGAKVASKCGETSLGTPTGENTHRSRAKVALM